MNESHDPKGHEHAPMEHDFTGPLSPPVKRFIRGFFVVAALLFLADFVVHRHTYHEAEKIPGFYAIYGFVGCVILVLVAKEMRRVVMRDEDYYDDPRDARAGDSQESASAGGDHPGGAA